MVVYYGVNLLVTAVFTYIITLTSFSADTIRQYINGDTTEFMLEIMEKVYSYSVEITVAIAAAVIPFMLLMRSADRKREYRLGLHEVYDDIPLGMFIPIAVMGAAACLTGNNLLYISGLLESYTEEVAEAGVSMWQGQLILELIGYGIVVPIAEELTFRGLVQKRFREYAGPKTAIILTAFVFGMYHGSLAAGIYAGLLGLLMGYVYEKSKTIIAPIVFHAGANIISVIVSESGIFDGIFAKGGAAFIIYVAAGAFATLWMLWLVQTRVDPKLLIPAAAGRKEEPESQNP